MNGPLRASSRRAVVALVAVWAALAMSPALAEIFKCSAKDGSPLYQNFPCEFDSLGSLPSPATADAAPTGATVSAAQHGKARSKSAAGAAAVPGALLKPTAATEPLVGMTEAQVKSMLGEPDDVLEDEPRSGRISIWRYRKGESVTFNVKRRVISVQPGSLQE
jgi:hypothetical protein